MENQQTRQGLCATLLALGIEKTSFGAALLGLILALGVAVPVDAAHFENTTTGLVSPGTTVTFDEFTFAQNTAITTQFSSLGVTFTNLFYDSQFGFFPAHFLGNFFPITNPFSVHFSVPQSAAAFQMITNAGTSTFTARLGGVTVESFTAPTDTDTSTSFFGFTGIVFDEILVTAGGSNGAALLDTVQAGGTPPAGGCPTHVHGHTFLFGHGNPASHAFGHTAGDPRHGHHFTCADHIPFHSPGGAPTGATTGPPGGLGFVTSTRGPQLSESGLQAEANEGLTDTGFVAALNQDGSLNGTALAARRGTVLQFFGSAAGLLIGEDDFPARRFTAPASGVPLYTTAPPEVRIGGVPARVLFSGMAPGLTGVWQVNVLIPDEVPIGHALPVTVLHDGRELKSVDVAIE